MKGCPFEYQRYGSPGELSPEDGERLYLNESLVLAIFGVEMCRAVVSKVHSSHNPKELGYLKNSFLILPAPQALRPEDAPTTPAERGGLAI